VETGEEKNLNLEKTEIISRPEKNALNEVKKEGAFRNTGGMSNKSGGLELRNLRKGTSKTRKEKRTDNKGTGNMK